MPISFSGQNPMLSFKLDLKALLVMKGQVKNHELIVLITDEDVFALLWT